MDGRFSGDCADVVRARFNGTAWGLAWMEYMVKNGIGGMWAVERAGDLEKMSLGNKVISVSCMSLVGMLFAWIELFDRLSLV
jgi:hypothetical protein